MVGVVFFLVPHNMIFYLVNLFRFTFFAAKSDVVMATSTYSFDTLDKSKWLRKISTIRDSYIQTDSKGSVVFVFTADLSAKNFEPIHLVTLACLIQFFYTKGYRVWLGTGNESVRKMLFDQLRFQEYWSGGKHHVDATSDNFFNLWRIVESEKDLYAKNVEKYFQNTFFKGKDLSIVSLSMIEAFYNVFDHAEAEGNAFSLIKYDEEDEVLNVAICDFGIGIAKSVRDFDDSISNDEDALLKSIEIDFTVKSKSHNRGKGLDNILSCSDVIRIVSNEAFLIKNSSIKTYKLNFNFGGTLIYFKLDLSKVEDEEILDEFNF